MDNLDPSSGGLLDGRHLGCADPAPLRGGSGEAALARAARERPRLAGPRSSSGCSGQRGRGPRDRRCPRRTDTGTSFPATRSPGRSWRAERPPPAPGSGRRGRSRVERRAAARIQRGAGGQAPPAWCAGNRVVRGSCPGAVVIAEIVGSLLPAPRERAATGPGEGSRSGSQRQRSLTGAGRKRPSGSGSGPPSGEQDRGLTGSGRSRAWSASVGQTGRPGRSAGPDPVLPSPGRASMAWRKLEGRRQPDLHPGPRAPRGVWQAGSPAVLRVTVLRIGCRSR